MAIVNYPEVQAKAQAELDAAVGPDRLPEFVDRVNLPYINAVISELLRWQPVVPMGILLTSCRSHPGTDFFLITGLPHTTTADDEYNGYFIPKNSAIMGNIWCVVFQTL